MFKFAIKNMAIKRVQIILIAVSIIISAGVAVLAYNTAEQVSEGITSNAGFYSAIVGPQGSATQLAMNTMYFTDEPLGTIPYSVVESLEKDIRVKEVIPYAIADSYNGHSVIGSNSAFLSSKEVKEGKMFDDKETMQVVVGCNVAKQNQLSIGDSIFTSHSASEEHHTPLTVVGVLEETHTAFDNAVFTQIRTIWDIHEHEEEEHDHNESNHDEHDHDELEGMVCAALVKTKNPGYAMSLTNEYNHKIITEDEVSYSLQAIDPMNTVRGVLQDADNTKYIVYVLCGIILVMNVLVIAIITILNLYHSKKEIQLMRLIGISTAKINGVYLIQNGITGIVSALAAFGLSRLCLGLVKGYVESMGVVLNYSKVYPLEFAILASVIVITIVPTIIGVLREAREKAK